MAHSSGAKIRNGWTLVERMKSPHVLLHQRTGFVWSVLDPENPRESTDLLKANVVTSSVTYDEALNRVLFPVNAEIKALDLQSREINTVLSLDEDDDRVMWVWPHPEKAHSLLLIACKMSPTRSQIAEQRKNRPTGESLSLSIKLSAFRLMSLSDERSHELCRFAKHIMAATFDWQRQRLYCWAEGDFLIEVDLVTGGLRYHQFSGFSGVAISTAGEPLAWSRDDKGIVAVSPDGRRRFLSRFGTYPSVSKNGDMAFVDGNMKLWLSRSGRKPEPVLDANDEAQPIASIPSWCPCGRHVAAELIGYRKHVVTAIAEIEKREILAIPHDREYVGLLWINRDRLAGL